MLTLYLVCFIVGGVLVASSALFGGHEGGPELHHDLDHDAGAGLEPADAAAEVEASHEIEAASGHEIEHGGVADQHAGGVWLPFLSLRFWTFFAAFFGLTGLVFTGFGLAPAVVTLGASVGVGLASGTGVSWLYRALKRAQVDSSVLDEDLQGTTGRVLLPIEPGSEGLVRVASKGMVKDLRAVTDDPGAIGRGEQALVVEVRAGVARVTALREPAGSADAAERARASRTTGVERRS